MEKVVEQTLLYDFYGELLNSHQKEIYEAIVFDDMSYSEVATEKGISRQGVFDAMKRCDHILKEYEEKLHLVERFLETRRQAAEIKQKNRYRLPPKRRHHRQNQKRGLRRRRRKKKLRP